MGVDPVRVAAQRIALAYCDDHPNYFSWRDCRIGIASRLSRAFDDPAELERIERECGREAAEAVMRGGSYTKAFQACVNRHLNGGGGHD